MKPTELLAFLSRTIAARIPVLITGAPGIGKSDIVAQAAADADADLILSHPAVADPTDAKGLPWVTTDTTKKTAVTRATFLPFGELQQAIDARTPTVWFLDDLGQASPAVQASYMQLLLARRVNGHALPECVTFIAATNRRTDRAGVSGILEPVKSRFGSIVELTPDLDDWCTWAIDADVAPELIAFLRFKSDLLCAFSATNDLTNSPVPRTWSHVNQLLKLQLNASVQQQALSGAVGEGAAIELLAFLKLAARLPSIDQILIDPKSVAVPKQPAVLYALASALAYRTTEANFERIAQYVHRMVDAGQGEFAVLCVKDCMRREPKVTQTRAFVKLATGDVGKLISDKD